MGKLEGSEWEILKKDVKIWKKKEKGFSGISEIEYEKKLINEFEKKFKIKLEF